MGGIADSGFVMRMTRGRLWIGLLGLLLVGIVGLNVWALSLNASSSKVARQTDGLKRANSALQAQIAGQLSNEQVQAAATKLGLIVPEPGSIRYLGTGGDDAAVAARRLANGDFTLGSVASAAADPGRAGGGPNRAGRGRTGGRSGRPRRNGSGCRRSRRGAAVTPPATTAGGVVAP